MLCFTSPLVQKSQGINCTGGRQVITNGDQKLEVKIKSKEEEIQNPLKMLYLKGDSQTLEWIFPDSMGWKYYETESYLAQHSLTEQQ